jgi:gamma-F420-2:alpha-L-glutamate ligase
VIGGRKTGYMEAWLIYNRDGAEYNKGYIQIYMEEGNKLGVNIRLILVENLELGVMNNIWFLNYNREEVDKPDFVICRAIYPLLSRQLEFMGIPVFNNSFVSEICNDKARTYQYLAKTGIKMVDTSFYLNAQIGEVLSACEQGTVVKTVDGHGGNQVFLIDDHIKMEHELNETGKQEIYRLQSNLGSSDIVVQPFTGNRHQDLRVYIIGKEIVAAVLRTSREGFRANFSLGGEVALYHLSDEEKAIVNLIINQFDFGLVGIDFIIGDEGELIFNEIEDVVGARMLYQCSDINIAERYLKFIIEKLTNKQ